MDKHIYNNIGLIEQYLLGNLTDKQNKEVEQLIKDNADFAEQVEAQRLLIQTVRRKALRSEIEKASKVRNGNWWKWGGGAILLGVIIYFALPFFQDDKIVEIPIVENEVELASNDFRGLKTWIDPDIQTFHFNAEDGATIEGKDGILVIVPPNGLVDTDGNVVKGPVDFELVEAVTMDDMVLYNLTTTSGDKNLETGGMFYTNATKNGNQLQVNPNRPLYVEVPTDEKKSGMMAFKGEVTPEGNITWKEPKKLKKFLNLIDFKNLDFLPEGFEDRIKQEEKGSPFYLSAKRQIDSLYYTLSCVETVSNLIIEETAPEVEFERVSLIDEPAPGRVAIRDTIIKNVVKVKKRKKVRKRPLKNLTNTSLNFAQFGVDISNVEEAAATATPAEYEGSADSIATEETFCCGVDPLTVKTILHKNFANSFIATKEFEARLALLHKAKNGDDLVKLYINNLGKDMWEVDSMVMKRLKGKLRQQFILFKNERLTNIKDADIYQKQLSAFYNKKMNEEKEALKTLKNKLAKMNSQELAKLQADLKQLRKEAGDKFDKTVQQQIANRLPSSAPVASVANSQTYSTPWFSFGWANIDRYLKTIGEDSKKVTLIANDAYPNVKIYQWLNIINTLTPITVSEGKGVSIFPASGTTNAKRMSKTKAIAISREGDNMKWAVVTFNPYKQDSVIFKLEPAHIDLVKSKLASLNIKTEPLIKRLKTVKQLEKEEAERRRKLVEMRKKEAQKRKEREEYVNRHTEEKQKELQLKHNEIAKKYEFELELRQICFPCNYYGTEAGLDQMVKRDTVYSEDIDLIESLY